MLVRFDHPARRPECHLLEGKRTCRIHDWMLSSSSGNLSTSRNTGFRRLVQDVLEPVFFCTHPVRQPRPDFQPVIPGAWRPFPKALMPFSCLDPIRPSNCLISESGRGTHYHSPLRFDFNFKRGTKRANLSHLTGGNLEVLDME